MESPWRSSTTAPQSLKFYSVTELAAILGLSRMTLYRAIADGEFPAVKIRGRYIVPARVVEAMSDSAVTTGSAVDSADWVSAKGAA